MSPRLLPGLLALGLIFTPSWGQSLFDSGQALPGVWAGAAAWGDYDGDGDPDLALIGETVEAGQCLRIARLFRNDAGLLVEDEAQRQRLRGVYYGDVAWGDYDGDGDLDLAVAGWDEAGGESLLLYRNDADAADPARRLFTLDIDQSVALDAGDDTALLTGVRYARLAWSDYDGDGDLDLAVAGMDRFGLSLTRFYRNERGIFSPDELNANTVLNVHNATLAWGDYDGDGDPDLAVSGENVTRDGGLGGQTEFYQNIGQDTLRLDESLEIGFDLRGGDLAWGDYDQDGTLDLAVSGRDGAYRPQMAIFRNRPVGFLGFDEGFAPNPFAQLAGRLAWSDYDGDGDLDLAASGRSLLGDYAAAVYSGDGTSLDAFSTESEVIGLAGGAVEWADYDLDGRPDLLLSGVDAEGGRHALVYANFGPNFNAPPSPPTVLNPPRIAGTRLVFSWGPGNDDSSNNLTYDLRIGNEPGRHDILSGAVPEGPGNAGAALSRVLNRFLPRGTYFWSVRSVDAAGARSAWASEQVFRIEQFTASEQRLEALSDAGMAWGDYDDDGDLDAVLMGQDRGGEAQTLLYDNGDGQMVRNRGVELVGLRRGAAAWGDFDGDGDLDLVTAGEDIFANRFSFVYETVGAANQRRLVRLGDLGGRVGGGVDWGDIDNDGDIDLLLTGQTPPDAITGLPEFRTDVFINTGTTLEAAPLGLVGLGDGEGAWGDYDSDGDLDLALTGQDNDGLPRLMVYGNDGAGNLSDTGQDLPGMQASDVAWGDFDRDGDLDLAAAGETLGGALTAVFRNDQGRFAAVQGAEFAPLLGGDLAWGDFDNDQDLDLVASGTPDRGTRFLEVYENTIGRTDADVPFEFRDIFLLREVGMARSATALVDIEADGDLDLVSVGQGNGFNALAVVADNLEGIFNANLAPLAPQPEAAADDGDTVVLSWGPGSDDGEPPPASLSYQLRVGTQADSNDVFSGAFRLGMGNVGHNLAHRLTGLASGVYFWQVQTVDAGWARSAWSAPDSFTVDTVPPTLVNLGVNRRQAGIGRTVTLTLSFADAHAGIDENSPPEVVATLGGEAFPFTPLQFTGASWTGELTVTAAMAQDTATVTVRGLKDRKGNELVPVDSVGVFSVDTVVPQVVGSEPAPGAVAVPSGLSNLRVTFSEPIEPATVVGSFLLKLAGVDLELLTAPTYDAASRTVTFVPADGLLPGSRYTVEVSAAVQDLAGNRPDNAITWNFETAVPQIVSLAPDAGQSDVPVDEAVLRIVFDNAIDETALRAPGGVTLTRAGQSVPLNEPAYDPETRTVIVAPTRGLRAGSQYSVRLNAAIGGLLRQVEGPYAWDFSTLVPALAGADPAPDAEGVAVGTPTIQAFFSAPTARQVPGDFRLTARPLERPEIPAALIQLTGFGADSSGTVISFSPQGGLQPATEYRIIGAPEILGELAPGGFEWRFQTAPRLADAAAGGTVANGGAQVELVFPPNALDGGSGEIAIRPVGPDADAGPDGPGKRLQELPAAPEGLSRVGRVYAIDAGDGTLRKPVTLKMRYSAADLGDRDATRLAVFRLEDGAWTRVGGVPGETVERQIGLQEPSVRLEAVRTAVTRLGTFALFEDLNAAVGALRIGQLDCQPRAFSPVDGLGQTDISFRLTGPADVTVRVYNASGRLERVVARDQPLAAGVASLPWDGRDGDRRLVASGLYIVVVTAGDARREQIVAVVR